MCLVHKLLGQFLLLTWLVRVKRMPHMQQRQQQGQLHPRQEQESPQRTRALNLVWATLWRRNVLAGARTGSLV